MLIDFSGQTALVTGATRGIGAAIARQLAASGASVIATGTDKVRLSELQREADAGHSPVLYERVDFADSRDTEAFAARVAMEPISVLVNNAAINILGHTDELDMEVWDRMQRVNLRAPTVLCRAIAPRMAHRGYGRIVNITSVFAQVSRTRRISYTTGKSGLAGLTRALALDYAGSNVLVNALAPGIIDTELTRRNLSEKERAEVIAAVPLQRMGTEEEIARAVAFLVSGANSFIPDSRSRRTEALPVSDGTVANARRLTIRSHRGAYTVDFGAKPFAGLEGRDFIKTHFIVDSLVAKLYAKELADVLRSPSVLQIEANEQAKSLERFPAYIEHLTSKGVRRDHRLVAIGGGIIQDISAFISSMLLRGLDWEFHPTTLLAQADSCIGSKTSINVGNTKNIVGNFWPPRSVYISTEVQKTLADADVRSGIGEMLKIHGVAGPDRFDRIAADYESILSDDEVMQAYIRRSLEIKVPFIETDEFDQAERLVLNYGHSFGHAIEAATQFAVPHGIGVTLGCDMANFVSSRMGRLSEARFREMHGVLSRNASGFTKLPVPIEPFRQALGKDKKNRGDRVTLILPNAAAKVEKIEVENDARFQAICEEYLTAVRGS